MRKGVNPAKTDDSVPPTYSHRIIVPVYVPNLEGFFAEGLDVLRICLDTLAATVHNAACITVVNNGSCAAVRAELDARFADGEIHSLTHHAENVGKVDAMMGVVRGCHEPLITLTDADVLFEPGWIEAVEDAFIAFPECGLVSPCPVPAVWRYCNSSTLLSGLIGGRGGYGALIRRDELLRFPASIEREDLYDDRDALLDRQLVLERGGTQVVVGAGHFVATVRHEIFEQAPRGPSRVKYGKKSVATYVDLPVDRSGLLRVGTGRVLAHHIGNSVEPWMCEIADRARSHAAASVARGVPAARRTLAGRIPFAIRSQLMRGLKAPTLRRLFLKRWGVPYTDDIR